MYGIPSALQEVPESLIAHWTVGSLNLLQRSDICLPSAYSLKQLFWRSRNLGSPESNSSFSSLLLYSELRCISLMTMEINDDRGNLASLFYGKDIIGEVCVMCALVFTIGDNVVLI